MTLAVPNTEPAGIDPDWELLRRVAGGDAQAGRRLVDAHLAAITRFAFRMLGNAAEAEDVAQETFIRLWRQAATWEPRAKVSTWLHRVAHNLCIDRIRGRRDMHGSELLESADPRPSVPAQLEQLQKARALTDAMQALPERQLAAITLVYYQGLDNKEAAEVMGVGVEAIESLLARARRTLKKRMSGAGAEPDGAG